MYFPKRFLRLATLLLAVAGVAGLSSSQLSAAPKKKTGRKGATPAAPAASPDKKPAVDPAIIREVQNALTELGFYFGVVDGEFNADTQGAVRRFQLYKGLGNSGMINEPTLAALRRASEEAAMEPRRGSSALSAAVRPKGTPAPASASTPKGATPPPLEKLENPLASRSPSGAASSAAVRPAAPPPRQQNPPVEARAQPVQPAESAQGPYHAFLRGTPYASMPLLAQQDAIRQVQAILARERFYHGPMDGAPTPATEEALYRVQSAYGLPLTGRLDAPTLQLLRHISPHRASASMARGRRELVRPRTASPPEPPTPSQAAQAAQAVQEPRTLGPAGKMLIRRSSQRPPQQRHPQER